MATEWLKSLLNDEHEAVSNYSQAAKDARKTGQDALARLFLHIRKEEEHHAEELKAQMPHGRD